MAMDSLENVIQMYAKEYGIDEQQAYTLGMSAVSMAQQIGNADRIKFVAQMLVFMAVYMEKVASAGEN